MQRPETWIARLPAPNKKRNLKITLKKSGTEWHRRGSVYVSTRSVVDYFFLKESGMQTTPVFSYVSLTTTYDFRWNRIARLSTTFRWRIRAAVSNGRPLQTTPAVVTEAYIQIVKAFFHPGWIKNVHHLLQRPSLQGLSTPETALRSHAGSSRKNQLTGGQWKQVQRQQKIFVAAVRFEGAHDTWCRRPFSRWPK